jgi:hypothetical protein
LSLLGDERTEQHGAIAMQMQSDSTTITALIGEPVDGRRPCINDPVPRITGTNLCGVWCASSPGGSVVKVSAVAGARSICQGGGSAE